MSIMETMRQRHEKKWNILAPKTNDMNVSLKRCIDCLRPISAQEYKKNTEKGKCRCDGCWVRSVTPTKPKGQEMKCWWCHENMPEVKDGVPLGSFRQGAWLCFDCFPEKCDPPPKPEVKIKLFSEAKWSFDPGKLGFSIRKKFANGTALSLLNNNTNENRNKFEWYAEKTFHESKVGKYGEMIGETTYTYYVRKVGEKYRVKLEWDYVPDNIHLEPTHRESVWDCVIKDEKMFGETMTQLLDEVTGEHS